MKVCRALFWARLLGYFRGEDLIRSEASHPSPAVSSSPGKLGTEEYLSYRECLKGDGLRQSNGFWEENGMLERINE